MADLSREQIEDWRLELKCRVQFPGAHQRIDQICDMALTALSDDVRVPREPTPEMIEAGYRAIGATHYDPHAGSKGWGAHAVDVYKAMLAASEREAG
jgi:hypothetical protein